MGTILVHFSFLHLLSYLLIYHLLSNSLNPSYRDPSRYNAPCPVSRLHSSICALGGKSPHHNAHPSRINSLIPGTILCPKPTASLATFYYRSLVRVQPSRASRYRKARPAEAQIHDRRGHGYPGEEKEEAGSKGRGRVPEESSGGGEGPPGI